MDILSSSEDRVEDSGHFQMWIMFTPTGGHEVPLRSVNWYWNGTAIRISNGWMLQSNPGDHSVDPGSQPTEEYPLWKSILDINHYVPVY